MTSALQPLTLPDLDACWRTIQDDSRLSLHAATYAWAAQQFEAGWVVDVGCEYGFGSALLSRANPNLRVLGVDIDVDVLALAKHILGESNTRLVRGTAGHLPLKGESVTGVCLFNVVHLVANPLRVLEEAHRVLQNGQSIVVTLPLDDNLATAWQHPSPAATLERLVTQVFASINFPTRITSSAGPRPAQAYQVGPHTTLLVALATKHPP